MDIKIRNLTIDDLPAIKAIEKAIMFSRDQDYIDAAIRDYFKDDEGLKEAALGAEVDGKLAGFIIGRTTYWEYGKSTKTGWIIALGVSPDYQGSGIGKKLGNKLKDHFKKVGVKKFKAVVDWDESDLIAYLKGLGFDKGKELVLEIEF